MDKIRVGILFGGRSAEHEISLLSALNIIDSINREKYDPFLIGIDKEGEWYCVQRDAIISQHDSKHIALDVTLGRKIVLAPSSRGDIRLLDTGAIIAHVDVIFPILHGPFGEDGTVQGLLRLAGIPFVGAGVLGSAVGMDKDVMKRLLRDAHIPVGRWMTIYEQSIPSFKEAATQLGLPLFVKPANLGSSVGVSKVSGEEGFHNAIKEAFHYDLKVLIEEYIKGREIECAVLDGDVPIASVPGEVIPSHDFYSYDAKYLDEHGASTAIPAKISDETTKRIQELSIKTFQTLYCEGFARVDFFLTEQDEIFVNEINTIPGFTPISMYPKLMEATGIQPTELIDHLITLAIERFKKEQLLKTART